MMDTPPPLPARPSKGTHYDRGPPGRTRHSPACAPPAAERVWDLQIPLGAQPCLHVARPVVAEAHRIPGETGNEVVGLTRIEREAVGALACPRTARTHASGTLDGLRPRHRPRARPTVEHTSRRSQPRRSGLLGPSSPGARTPSATFTFASTRLATPVSTSVRHSITSVTPRSRFRRPSRSPGHQRKHNRTIWVINGYFQLAGHARDGTANIASESVLTCENV